MCYIDGKFKSMRHHKTGVFPPPYDKIRQADYVILTMEECAEIDIQYDCNVDSVCIRPESAKIKYSYSANKVKVYIDKAVNISVEINGGIENNVMIFADYDKSYNLDKYDNIISFSAGVHYADIIELSDNTAVYLEDGAYVHGCIKAENAKNIAVLGSGVLTLENYVQHFEKRDTGRDNLLFICNCQNVKIADTVITDGCNWSCKIYGCEDVEIDNLKVIGYRGNTDGIDICGSKNVYVHRCFTRVWDDSLVVKSRDCGNVDNVLFEGCTLWCDMARPIEVGVELRAEYVRNVTFRDIDIIHSMCGYCVLGIHHGDRARVSDITFENIRIEDAPSCQLFDIRITDSVWNKDKNKGPISNVLIKDVKYLGKVDSDRILSNSCIAGYSDDAYIDGVVIENVTVCGKSAFGDGGCGLDILDYTQNIKLISDETLPKAMVIETKINAAGTPELRENGMWSVPIALTLYNLDTQPHDFALNIEVSPCSTQYQSKIPIEGRIFPKQECEFIKELMLPAGKYALTVVSKDVEIAACCEFVDLKLVPKENINDSYQYFFDIDSTENGVRFALKGDLLTIQSDLLKNYPLVLHTALPTDRKKGEILFSVKETDMGLAPAIVVGKDKYIADPRLRNYKEITYVFKNQPEVMEYKTTRIAFAKNGIACVDLSRLCIKDCDREFLMELEIPGINNERYACTLFHSQKPEESSHMFVRVKR